MSHIAHVDLGSGYYSFTAVAMMEHLDALTKGDLVRGRLIPKRVLKGATELFDLTLKRIEYDKDPKHVPVPRFRTLAIEGIVIEMLEASNGKTYYPNDGEFEKDVRHCSEILHELPDKIRYNQSQYEPLRDFFKNLWIKSEARAYEKHFSGKQSKHTTPMGS